MLQGLRTFDEGAEWTLAEPADCRRFDRLGGKHVELTYRQAQKVAGEQKAGDLASTVRQQFVDPERPRRDVEHMGRRFAFPRQNRSGRQLDDFSQASQAFKIAIGDAAADAQRPRAAAVAIVDFRPVDTSVRKRSRRKHGLRYGDHSLKCAQELVSPNDYLIQIK
ncbi:hypothetical protein GGR11_002611 [Brevundimonas mediterranea]|uniref:Uncharacterized protein n=1 Tax=Brevundimonas mediterranea TaxID=74329 RepID=A0A7W6F0R0_9CAUL|nr:hypothetical protein [Brevundimonas mediterranea]